MGKGLKQKEQHMSLATALAKIWQANSHEELEKASREFTENLEELKGQIQRLGAAVAFGQTRENTPRTAAGESSQS